jgi:MerR family transcriptional regulator, light-induced transcriptional regulator
MSVRKQEPPSSTGEWLSEHSETLVLEITGEHFRCHPELETRYGRKGRERCMEDTAYHLHYLAEAVAADSATLFTSYLGWAKIMLSARGIPVTDLISHLRTTLSVVARRASKDDALEIANIVNAALDALPQLPDEVPTFLDPQKPLAADAEKYLRALLLLDRDGAIEPIITLVELGTSVSEVFEHILVPVQQEVGRLWQQNQITVVQEHFCTAATDLLISKLTHLFVAISRQVSALTMCTEGEEHCLGIKMLTELLQADGWRVAYVGANPPISDVIKYLRRHPTDLAAISVVNPMNLSRARELIAAVRALPPDRRPKILVGGAALNAEPALWKKLGADGYGESLLEGVEQANRLVRAA